MPKCIEMENYRYIPSMVHAGDSTIEVPQVNIYNVVIGLNLFAFSVSILQYCYICYLKKKLYFIRNILFSPLKCIFLIKFCKFTKI